MAQSERNLTAIFQDTANAIRSKTGGTNQINPRDFADEIEAIPTGSQEIVPGPNDNVIVYDYDGTVLDAQQVAVGSDYTLPTPPEHEGLTFESWTCTTAAVNGKITIPTTKQVRVGATYHTTSGHIEIDVNAPKNIEFKLNSSWTNVDWGDGTITTNSNIHTYAQAGHYTIKVLTNVTTWSSAVLTGGSAVTAIRLPNTITSISDQAFTGYRNLKHLTLPNSLSSTMGDVFYGSPSRIIIIIPNSVQQIGSLSGTAWFKKIVLPAGINFNYSGFQYNAVLDDVILPQSITGFQMGSMFKGCLSIPMLVIGSGITSILSEEFQNCATCGIFDFSSHASVPTLESTNAFDSINANAKIIVPDALYNDWIAATNWSNLASHIIRASEA